MAQIFPRWANRVPRRLIILIIIGINIVVFGVWYFFSPEYTDVGYAPKQPIAFSHQIHAGQLDLDCQYCHTNVDQSAHANIPAVETCMNCHSQIKEGSKYGTEEIAKVVESYEQDEPIEWIRVHNLPDYAAFNHSAHVNAGVGCESCHGRIDQMEVVAQKEPLSMSWCLDCHRQPEKFVRPEDEVTTMGFKPEENQLEMGRRLVAEQNIHPPTYCQGCHY